MDNYASLLQSARGMFQPGPISQWSQAYTTGQETPELRQAAIQQAINSASFVGGVQSLGNRYGYVVGEGARRLRNTLPIEDFKALDIARDILKSRGNPQALKENATKTIDTLAEYVASRDVVDKYKGSPLKLANWITKNIKEAKQPFDIPNLLSK